MDLQDFTNSKPRKWPKRSDASYDDLITEVLQLYDRFNQNFRGFEDNISTDLIELSIVSMIRDQNTRIAKIILAKMDAGEAILGYAMTSFHCLKRNIDCKGFLDTCDRWLENNTPIDGRVLSYMALNKYLLGETTAYEHYKSKAFERVEEWDQNRNKWAYINMLIFSNCKETAQDLISEWRSNLSSTFYVPILWYNISQYCEIESLFWFKDQVSKIRDEPHSLYPYFQEKIIRDHLGKNLEQYTDQFGEYGLRMVYEVLYQLSEKDDLQHQEIDYWLSKESVESLDFVLLLYALRFKKNCRDFINQNAHKLTDFKSNNFSNQRVFNYGKISSLIDLRIDQKVAPSKLNFPSYFAGLAYYSESKSVAFEYLEKAIKRYLDNEDSHIDELCLILESSYRINYDKHNALVNFAIYKAKQKDKSYYIKMGSIVKSLSKIGDFENAYKVFKKTPKGKRSSCAPDLFRNLCDEKNYSGIIDMMNHLNQANFNELKFIFRAVISLNNFRGNRFQLFPEGTYKLI